jgi:methionyl-tRNA formyltransferase
VRAFNPFPGATAQIDGQSRSRSGGPNLPPERAKPGTVLAAGADGIVVACGEGALRLTELQKAGGKRLAGGGFPARLRPQARPALRPGGGLNFSAPPPSKFCVS